MLTGSSTPLAGLGINDNGVFSTIRSINKLFGHSRASTSWAKGDLRESYVLHPAILDVAFQAGLATFASLAENAMGCTYLPAGISHVIVDPTQRYQGLTDDTSIIIEAQLAHLTDTKIELDINVWDSSSIASGIQADGLILKLVMERLPSDDRLLFAKMV